MKLSIKSIINGSGMDSLKADKVIQPLFDHTQVLLPIYAEEVRQYLYCKRVMYWRKVCDIFGTSSNLMKKGVEYHKLREKQTYVRKHDIQNFKNRFYFHDEFQIGGKIDLLRVLHDQIIPVEFKRFHNSNRPPTRGHVVQAIIGGIAAEFEIGLPMYEIELNYFKGKRSTIQITETLRNNALNFVDELREMIKLQRLPEPVKERKKCRNCEFWKICMRV